MLRKELTPSEFQQFQEFIYMASGIQVRETKRTLLSNRLRRRCEAIECESFADYFELLQSPAGRKELGPLLDAVTTNETSFFRTQSHFDWLEGDFVKDMINTNNRTESHPRSNSIRVWSAACSTGEEPYSIAISLLRNRLRLKDWKLEVVGTDINREVLEVARTGQYGAKSFTSMDPAIQRRYFQKSGDKWEVSHAVKEFVTFRHHNLIEPLRLPSFDCIFLRNVLIYFNDESKRKVVENVVSRLKTDGYLVVGPTEGIFDMLGMLKKCSPFLYQKP